MRQGYRATEREYPLHQTLQGCELTALWGKFYKSTMVRDGTSDQKRAKAFVILEHILENDF